jgi:tetratricopeptide (TPR) repeat protein
VRAFPAPLRRAAISLLATLGGQRDAAAAASYYRAALRGDPRNNELLGRTFLAVLANGEVDEAVKLAERVLQVDKTDRIARLVLGVRAIKQKQYPIARRELAQSIRGRSPILPRRCWRPGRWRARPRSKAATDSIDKLAGRTGMRSSRICTPR